MATTNRREFLRACGAGAMGLLASRVLRAADGRRPNLVFIMSDDHAAHALSCYGSRINQTPHLDRIARGGLRFDNCFCTNSLCAPCRAVILSGKYSHLNGVRDNRQTFDGSQVTLPKQLGAAGYQTAMVGKWHLKSEPTGFDYWNVLPGQGAYHNPQFIENGERKQHDGYVTDLIADFSLNWLDQRDPSRPFFLMCHHKAPHRNWQPDEQHAHLYDDETIPEPVTFNDDYATRSDAARQQQMSMSDLTAADLKGAEPPAGLSEADLKSWRYQRYIKDYLRCIASVDDNVGRVLDYLDAAGLADNTLVVYTSDQGFFLGDHGWFDKRFMYEESLRMPLLVRYPELIQPGTVNDDLVLNLDFAPTFLGLAGAPIPADLQGVNFAPLLEGKTPGYWRKSIYYHYYEYPGAHSVKRHYGVRTKRWKLLHFYNDIDAWELYDLADDPHELHNLYGQPEYAAMTAELKAELERLRQEYHDDSRHEATVKTHPELGRLESVDVKNSKLGYDLTADGQGYAVRKLPQPLTGLITLHCQLQTKRGRGTRNGLVCFGPSGKSDELLKVGVYIGASQLVILRGKFGGSEENILRQPLKFDQSKLFDVTIHLDLNAKTIRLVVDGEELTGELPESWQSIAYVGYNLNSTETSFSPLEVSGG